MPRAGDCPCAEPSGLSLPRPYHLGQPLASVYFLPNTPRKLSSFRGLFSTRALLPTSPLSSFGILSPKEKDDFSSPVPLFYRIVSWSYGFPLSQGRTATSTCRAPSGKQCWRVKAVGSFPLLSACPDDLLLVLALGRWLAAVWGPRPPRL